MTPEASPESRGTAPSDGVSAVMAVWNGAASVERALDSIASQSAPPAEIIVVDDGSTDETSVIVRAWGEAHPDARLRCITQPNAGPAAARNRGVDAASSRWVAFLDADDRWHQDKLARQLVALDSRPELVLLGTRRITRRPGRLGHVHPLSLRRLLVVNVLTTSSVIVDRATFLAHEGFPTQWRRSEDYDLWLRIAAAGQAVGLLDEPLVIYGEGKATFGASGLSADLWALERCELGNFARLRRRGDIGPGTWLLASAWSVLKFQRRVVLTAVARR